MYPKAYIFHNGVLSSSFNGLKNSNSVSYPITNSQEYRDLPTDVRDMYVAAHFGKEDVRYDHVLVTPEVDMTYASWALLDANNAEICCIAQEDDLKELESISRKIRHDDFELWDLAANDPSFSIEDFNDEISREDFNEHMLAEIDLTCKASMR